MIFWLLLLMFLAIFVPLVSAVCNLVSLIKFLRMDKEEGKRYRRKERAVRSAVLLGISGAIICLVSVNLFDSIWDAIVSIPLLLLAGTLLFVLPAALVVWLCISLHHFVHTDKTDTEQLRKEKIWLIVSACVTVTIVPAEVILVYIPLLDMNMM